MDALAPLQKTMESRTHLGMVGQLSTAGGAMGISYRDVSSLCQCRLSDDHTQTVMKPLLVIGGIIALVVGVAVVSIRVSRR